MRITLGVKGVGDVLAGRLLRSSSDEDVVPARGSRPPCLGEPRGPQERDQPRTVEQIAVYAPMVQILDAPVLQLVEQLPDVLRFFDLLLPVPEQAIEVPKILLDDVPVRAVLREPQLVEQLVEVPTTVSYAALLLWQALHGFRQRTVEQNVDIPAVGGSGTGGGPSGFLPGQSYSVTAEQIVDNPVRPGGAGDLQSFPRGQGSTAFLEQIAEFPVPLLLSTRGRRERAERIPERAQQRLHHDRTVTKHFPSEVSSPQCARHLDRSSAPRILRLLICWLTRTLRCAPRARCGLRTPPATGLVHQGTLH